jgi:hypothetical protein
MKQFIFSFLLLTTFSVFSQIPTINYVDVPGGYAYQDYTPGVDSVIWIEAPSCGGFAIVNIQFNNELNHRIDPDFFFSDSQPGYLYFEVDFGFSTYELFDENNKRICRIEVRPTFEELDSIKYDSNLRTSNDTIKFCSFDPFASLMVDYYYSSDLVGTGYQTNCSSNDNYLKLYKNGQEMNSHSLGDLDLKTGDSIQFVRSRGFLYCDCELEQQVEELRTKKLYVYIEENERAYEIGRVNNDSTICPGETKYVRRLDNENDPSNSRWFFDGSPVPGSDSVGRSYPGVFQYMEYLSPGTERCPAISNEYELVKGENCGGYIRGSIQISGTQTKLSGIKVLSNKGHIVISDDQGIYEMYFDKDEYVDSLIVDVPGYKRSAVSISYSLDGEFWLSYRTLYLVPDRNNDLEIDLISGRNRPGFTIPYYVYLYNWGKNIATSDVKVELPSELTYLSNSGEVLPDSISGNQLFWFDVQVNQGGKLRIPFFAKLNRNTALDSELDIWAYLSGNSDDFASNDTSNYRPIVTGSYDPNDKNASYIGSADGDLITDSTRIDYTIRFQNTGTDTAFTIVIKDKITDKLDLSTFQMLQASHPYSVSVNEDSLIWTFNNILLPDSNTNEPASHGFVRFLIDQAEGNLPGTEIRNKAFIYFDYNDAIITNEYVSTVREDQLTSLAEISENLILFPNPCEYQLKVSGEGVGPNDMAIVYDVSGKQLMHTYLNNGSIDVQYLSSGTYFIQIQGKSKVLSGTFIVR